MASPSSISSRRVSCLGFISPRTATLLLALIGLLAHIQQVNYLGVLYDTFPHVPKIRPTTSIIAATPSERIPSLTAGGVSVVLDSEATEEVVVSTSELHSSSSSSSSSSSIPKDIIDAVNSSSSAASPSASASVWKGAAVATRPMRWFNLLPSRYQSSDSNNNNSNSNNNRGAASTTNTYMDQDYKARQRDQEKDRKSWEAARTLTRVIRLYAGLCAIAYLCGIVGVIRSNLFCTRIFVLSSALDLLWCALSLVSLGIIVINPYVRSLICEELSNTSTVIIDLDQSSGNNLRSSTGPVMLLSRAASTFWKRTITDSSASNSAENLSSTYWWDSLLDNVLENENCEDVLESVLLPLGLVACLIYLALRIHFLIVIRHYYVSLLREQMSYHLSRHHGNGPTSQPGERKYSSSSASSSTSTSDFASCLPSAHAKHLLRFDDSKLVNEKMA